MTAHAAGWPHVMWAGLITAQRRDISNTSAAGSQNAKDTLHVYRTSGTALLLRYTVLVLGEKCVTLFSIIIAFQYANIHLKEMSERMHWHLIRTSYMDPNSTIYFFEVQFSFSHSFCVYQLSFRNPIIATNYRSPPCMCSMYKGIVDVFEGLQGEMVPFLVNKRI